MMLQTFAYCLSRLYKELYAYAGARSHPLA